MKPIMITNGSYKIFLKEPFKEVYFNGSKTYTYIITCGVSPRAVYDLLHSSHGNPLVRNVMAFYTDDKGNEDYDLMSFDKAKELFKDLLEF